MRWTRRLRSARHVHPAHWLDRVRCANERLTRGLVTITQSPTSDASPMWDANYFLSFQKRFHTCLHLIGQTTSNAPDACHWARHVGQRLAQDACAMQVSFAYKYGLISRIKDDFQLLFYKHKNLTNTIMNLKILQSFQINSNYWSYHVSGSTIAPPESHYSLRSKPHTHEDPWIIIFYYIEVTNSFSSWCTSLIDNHDTL